MALEAGTKLGHYERVAILVVGAFSIAGCTVPAASAEGPQLHMVLDGHTQLVTSVAIAPSGDLMVSGSVDGTMKIWDLATGSERLTLDGHGAGIWSVEFLDEGRMVASGDQYGNIKLWNVALGTETTSIVSGGRSSSDVPRLGSRFSIHGTLLAHSEGERVILTDFTSGEDHQTLSRPSRSDLAWVWGFAAQGRTLVVSSYMHEVVLWDTETGSELLIIPDEHVLSVAIAPDETQLAAGPGSDGGAINLWDMANGELLASLPGHTLRVWAVDFSPDGQTLASAGWDQSVRLWDVASATLLATLQGLPRFYDVAFSGDGRLLVAAGGLRARGSDGVGGILVWKLGRSE